MSSDEIVASQSKVRYESELAFPLADSCIVDGAKACPSSSPEPKPIDNPSPKLYLIPVTAAVCYVLLCALLSAQTWSKANT